MSRADSAVLEVGHVAIVASCIRETDGTTTRRDLPLVVPVAPDGLSGEIEWSALDPGRVRTTATIRRGASVIQRRDGKGWQGDADLLAFVGCGKQGRPR